MNRKRLLLALVLIVTAWTIAGQYDTAANALVIFAAYLVGLVMGGIEQ